MLLRISLSISICAVYLFNLYPPLEMDDIRERKRRRREHPSKKDYGMAVEGRGMGDGFCCC